MPGTTAHLVMVHSGKTYGYTGQGGAHPKAGETHELFTYGIFLKILPGRPQMTTEKRMDEVDRSVHVRCLGDRLSPRRLMVTSQVSVSEDVQFDHLNGEQQGLATLLSRPLPSAPTPLSQVYTPIPSQVHTHTLLPKCTHPTPSLEHQDNC